MLYWLKYIRRYSPYFIMYMSFWRVFLFCYIIYRFFPFCYIICRFFLCYATGRRDILRNKDKAREMYIEIQNEIHKCVAYLKEKRDKDPYRNLLARLAYQSFNGFDSQVPTFDIWFFYSFFYCTWLFALEIVQSLDSINIISMQTFSLTW